MEFDSTKIDTIEASVYYADVKKDRYFVKISFFGTGMYINSFKVQPSKYEGQKYWVQQPTHQQGGGWTPTVDFEKEHPLWEVIEQKALDAVNAYKENGSDKKPTGLSRYDSAITIEDIPF